MTDTISKHLQVSATVQKALENGSPVVALESTLISHGLPYPQNQETAQLLEKTVRDAGATPATIAIIKGKIKVGLSEDDVHYIATSEEIRKVSRRDLPIVVAQKADGATTVAATMYIAHLAGIAVFATGGIGGVHRGHPFDVSADLPELARTPVVVVCAGAKAILDLPLTLEYLETQGVPILGYQTAEFPAFYTRRSGLSVDAAVNTPTEVARIVQAKRELGLHGGVLVAAPVPPEDELPRGVIEEAIATALHAAEEQEITGKDTTPFLLDYIGKQTEGKSIATNISLLKNNARVAAQIACELCK